MRISAVSFLALVTALASATNAHSQTMPSPDSAVAADPAASQSEATGELGDIVVTAQRRAQRLQDVGIAITAFSGEQLTNLGVRSSQDLVLITPGLRNPSSGSGFTSSFSLRGLSQSDFGASQEAPVALYIDDVYQASQGASQFLLFDIDRTEVLRGPQGTLFGRNATGGLVHFITKRPDHNFGGYVDVSYGRFNEIKPEAAINVPLSDTLATRVSFSGDWHDSIVQNTTGRDLWNGKRYAARAQLLWEPSSDVSFLINGRVGRVREVGQPYLWSAAQPTGPLGTGVLTPGQPDIFGFTNTGNGAFKVSVDPVAVHNVNNEGVTGTLTWNFGETTLTSITDFTHVRVDYTEDADAQPGEYYHYNGYQNADQFSQELRLNGKIGDLRWTLGGYYFQVDGNYIQEGLFTKYFEFIGFPGIGAQTTVYDLKTRSGSVFAQAEYQISSQFRVIVGGRYIRETKRQNYDSAFYDTPGGTKIGFGSSPDLLTFSGKDKQNLYSLKGELDWIPSRDVLVYLSYNRGVKAGGFNAPLDPSGASVFIDPNTFDPAPTADAAFRFKPETLHAYELGLKATLFDGMARFNASAFYYDYKNFQALNFGGVSTSYITSNNATLKGVDTELYATPMTGLNIVLGASYLDQKVKGVAVGSVLVDRKIPYAPEWNLTGLVRYEWDAFKGKLAAQLNGNYVSTQEFSLTNAQAARQKGYGIANARMSYTFPDENLTASIFVNNLTDKIYKVIAFDTAAAFGFATSQIGLPRTYGVSLRYTFGR